MGSNPDRPGGISPYFESKTLAERAAWEFQAALPESEKFEIATINPVFVMGPSICASDGTSEAWMASALDGSKTKIPGGATSFVDVRDCAIAHLRAMNFRKLPTNDSFSWKDSTTRRRHTRYLPRSTTRRATRFQPEKNQEDPQILPIPTNDHAKFWESSTSHSLPLLWIWSIR